MKALTPEERLALVRRDLERRSGRGQHPVVPYARRGRSGDFVGLCAICDEPVYEYGDFRGGRWRHGAPWGAVVR